MFDVPVRFIWTHGETAILRAICLRIGSTVARFAQCLPVQLQEMDLEAFLPPIRLLRLAELRIPRARSDLLERPQGFRQFSYCTSFSINNTDRAYSARHCPRLHVHRPHLKRCSD